MAWLLGVAVIGVSIYALILFRRYLSEREEGKRVRSIFSRYVPDVVVDELLDRKDPRLFQGREYYATIISCRIWNFGLFSEDLSPQQTLQYLNEFYSLVGQSVAKHKGMIESLRGDTITAVFGVLMEETFQEERGIRAALDIIRLVSAMSSRWQSQGRKPFQVGIGINSGNIIAGDAGYANRREFALVGNEVTVASRLQEATEEMKASIIAAASTFRVVEEYFIGVPVKTMPLRGMKRLQSAYIVRGVRKHGPDDDNLTLPPQRSFSRTEIQPEPPPTEYVAQNIPEPPPERTAAPPTFADPQKSSYTMPLVPPRIDPSNLPSIVSAPDRFSRLDDDHPAMPDTPPPTATYEDDTGPPFELPP